MRFSEVVEEVYLGEEVFVALELEPLVHYTGEGLLIQLFSIENNLSIYAL